MDKVKLPRSSYEELSKIITAYGALGKPSGLNDVVQASGIGKTVVSANNAFLNLIEVIEGGNKKSMTSKGLALSQALQHDMEEEIVSSWTEIINENDFLTKMVQAVRIRKGMEIGQLENHIAFSSGEKKSAPVRTGARAVVDILLRSSLLEQDGDKVSYSDSGDSTGSRTTVSRQLPSNPVAVSHIKGDSNVRLDAQDARVKINIELSIQAKPNELDGLGAKIKKILDELSETE